MPSSVEQIKERLSIADIVGSYIQLEKTGANLKAKCPFHNERTPSFFVSPARGSYYCFGCFPPGQLVKTPFGYHAIETIDANHYVYSGHGHIRKVLATQYREYQGGLIEVKTQKLGGTISLTSDHHVPIIRPKTKYYKKTKQFYRQVRGYQLKGKEGLTLNREKLGRYGDMLEVPAGELKAGDFVLYPITTSITDIPHIDLSTYLTKTYHKGPKPRIIPYSVPVSKDFLRLVGYYLAEGSNHRAYIRFSLGNHEEIFAREIVRLIKKVFGLKATIYRRSKIKTAKTGLEITVCHSYLADIFANLCGKGAEHKHIPFIFQELPPAKQMILVQAINKGDGHSFIPRLSSHVCTVLTIVSPVLIEQVTDILLRNNIFPSVSSSPKRIDKLGTNHKGTNSVKWSPTAHARHEVTYSNGEATYWLLPIKNVTTRLYQGPVYNLTVDEDHTYIAKNFAVSNCGAKGDIFSFVQAFEGLDFIGALRTLAARAGVEIIAEDPRVRDARERVYAVLETATLFFQRELGNEKKALEYLLKRGANEETISSWRIGFAPDSWHACSEYCRSKDFTDKEIQDAGLSKTEKGKTYDRFRSRIMFPIFDSSGRVVAFSGRLLGKETDLPAGKQDIAPKYLNSPETKVFSKSRVLYGFDRAKNEIRRRDYAMLVEGQMDLLMSHQAGFTNTVASSGTAFTEEQLQLLKRLSKRVLMVYDADKAGVQASLKSASLALKNGMEVKVAALPYGTDPAELIQKDVEKFKQAMRSSSHIIEFYLNVILNDKLEARALARALRDRLLPYVLALESSIERDHFVKRISEATLVREEAIRDDLQKIPRDKHPDREDEKEVMLSPRRNMAERLALGIIFWQGKLKMPLLEVSEFESALSKLFGKERYSALYNEAIKSEDELAFQAESYYGSHESLALLKDELLLTLEEDILKEELSLAMKELASVERKKDPKKRSIILSHCQKLSEKLHEIKMRRV